MAKRSILPLFRRRRTATRGMRVGGPECLEPRTVLAVFTVVPPDAPTDYFHFRTLQDALGAVSVGTPDQRDTIQIDPLADISSNSTSTGLLQSVPAGATQIQTPVSVAPGQVVPYPPPKARTSSGTQAAMPWLQLESRSCRWYTKKRSGVRGGDREAFG